MNLPLVTTFICSYNKERFVEAALESVRRQTFRDFELIVIDDCSTDDSVSIIDAWLRRTRFPCRFVRHEANQGVCRTVNEILSMARGRYIASLGADDLWYPKMLESFVRRMVELPSDVCALYGDAEVIDEEGRLNPVRFLESNPRFERPPEGRIFHILLEGNFIPSLAAMIRLDCLRAVGGYDESLWFEDWDMWLRLADRYAFAFLPGTLARYRVVRGSMTQSETWAPRLAASVQRIQLKWVGRDEISDRILAKAWALVNAAERAAAEEAERAAAEEAEQLYADASPGSLHCAEQKFRYQRDIYSLVLMLSIKLHVPYSVFRRVKNTAKALRTASQRWIVCLRRVRGASTV
jgi:glycosyltransferase involved in cell wall biosynthesis